MLLESIQSELLRLQMHPVNLGVVAGDGAPVTLRGSLLHYWKISASIDGPSFLRILRALPDAAGPEQVMKALIAAQPLNALNDTDRTN
jgi:hypothetical protein